MNKQFVEVDRHITVAISHAYSNILLHFFLSLFFVFSFPVTAAQVVAPDPSRRYRPRPSPFQVPFWRSLAVAGLTIEILMLPGLCSQVIKGRFGHCVSRVFMSLGSPDVCSTFFFSSN